MDPLEEHLKAKGKIEIRPKVKLDSREALSWAYTPGVAEVSRAIEKNKDLSFSATWRGNTVAIVSDGSRVLGLGNIGPEAGMPVMEGKAALFKAFGDVDAIPLCVDIHDIEGLATFVKAIQPSFGGINLEDIRKDVVIELFERLDGKLDIPVFHDDRQGTGIVTLAALINALKVVGKGKEVKVVLIGAGSAMLGIAELLAAYGFKDLHILDSRGVIYKAREDIKGTYKEKFLEIVKGNELSREDVFKGADVLIAASAPGSVKEEDLKLMADDAIIFTLANPVQEIPVEVSKRYARVVATGRSDLPNQVNNLLVFPGLFRGALDVRAKRISKSMMLAAAEALANTEQHPEPFHIIPAPFNRDAAVNVAVSVAEKAIEEGLARAPMEEKEIKKAVCRHLSCHD